MHKETLTHTTLTPANGPPTVAETKCKVILHLVLLHSRGAEMEWDHFYHSWSVREKERLDYLYLTNIRQARERCSNHPVIALQHLICHANGIVASLDK